MYQAALLLLGFACVAHLYNTALLSNGHVHNNTHPCFLCNNNGQMCMVLKVPVIKMMHKEFYQTNVVH